MVAMLWGAVENHGEPWGAVGSHGELWGSCGGAVGSRGELKQPLRGNVKKSRRPQSRQSSQLQSHEILPSAPGKPLQQMLRGTEQTVPTKSWPELQVHTQYRLWLLQAPESYIGSCHSAHRKLFLLLGLVTCLSTLPCSLRWALSFPISTPVTTSGLCHCTSWF